MDSQGSIWMEKAKESISNLQLLLAAGSGDTVQVKELIKKVADVNFQDAGGNTCLHFAANQEIKCTDSDSSINKVIEILLKQKSIELSVENCESMTALDIARKTCTQTENQKALRAIMKKVLEEANKISKKSRRSSDADQQDAESSNIERDNDEVTMDKNLSHEIERTKAKIKYCLELLQSTKKLELTYRKANIFLYFLETFALNDTYPKIPVNSQTKEILSKKKKQYFENLYPVWQKCYPAIMTMRNTLLHARRAGSLSLTSLKEICVHNRSIEDEKFFEELIRFCKFVSGSYDYDKKKTKELEKLTEFFKLLTKSFEVWNKSIKPHTHPSKDKFRDRLNVFWEKIDKLHEPKWEETLDELTFDLLVNIFPELEVSENPNTAEQRKMTNLVHLRHKLVHDFHTTTALVQRENIPVAVYRYLLITTTQSSSPSQQQLSLRTATDKSSVREANPTKTQSFEAFEQRLNRRLSSFSIICLEVSNVSDKSEIV